MLDGRVQERCVQVAQLELEAQRVQLEQEDAADPKVTPEAMQRLQQQVQLHCLPTGHKLSPLGVLLSCQVFAST